MTDTNGQKLDERTVTVTDAGHRDLRRWGARWPERTWALEDCRHLSRRLEADLLRAGERVLRVPPKLMAGARRGGRQAGKSDPIDALAVARAALREPDLPLATLDDPERDIRLLVDHRDDLVGTRTAAQNRLRWFLVELAIAEPAPRALDRAHVLLTLERDLADREETSARIARELVAQVRQLTTAIDRLEREIELLAAALAPSLRALTGCGPLTTAKLVGETAGIGRFRSAAAFAMHNGTAPVPLWSGDTVRHRLIRGGNRQLNVALHRIAITQLQRPGPGRDYISKRTSAGDTKTEAIRALRRRISDEVFRRLRHMKSLELRDPPVSRPRLDIGATHVGPRGRLDGGSRSTFRPPSTSGNLLITLRAASGCCTHSTVRAPEDRTSEQRVDGGRTDGARRRAREGEVSAPTCGRSKVSRSSSRPGIDRPRSCAW